MKAPRPFFPGLIACAVIAARTVCAESAAPVKPSPPGQPAAGPGGAEYAHGGLRETRRGSGAGEFWVIEPAKPGVAKAPLVIFLHGWTAFTPTTYRGWLRHLARRGNIIIYPRYQSGLLTPAPEFFPNALAAIRDALAVLREPGRVAPDLSCVAVVGHSAGGALAWNYAIRAAAENLPAPKCALLVQPAQGPERGVPLLPIEDGSALAAEFRLLVMTGDADGIVGATAARRVWRATSHLQQRAFVTVQSDDYGSPALRANHLSPVSWTREATDAVDWLAYWRTFDSLMDSTFAAKPLVIESGMGAWSDGTPVKPLKVER